MLPKINPRWMNYGWHLLLCAFAYYITARLGLLFATMPNQISPVWPASGVAVACIIYWGYSIWPAVLVGAAAASLSHSLPFTSAILIGFGTSIESLCAAFVLSNVLKRENTLKDHHEILAYLAAAAGPTVLAACIGVFSLWSHGLIATSEVVDHWVTWWIGDSLGILVVAPVLMSIIKKQSRAKWLRLQQPRNLFLLTGYLLVAFFIFFTPAAPYLPFLIYPMLVLAAHAGTLEIKLLSLLTYAISAGATMLGFGPFQSSSTNQNFISLQMYIASVAITAIAIGGLRRHGSLRLPALGLGLAWLITGSTYVYVIANANRQDELRFERLASEVVAEVRTQVESYEDILRGGAGLVATADEVSREAWNSYVITSRITERHPGIEGVGIVKPVALSEEKAFAAKLSRLQKRPITIQKAGGSPSDSSLSSKNKTRYVITHLDPLESNSRAVGLDIGAEPKRRHAADLAKAKGEAVFTERILLWPDYAKRKGFLLFVPIYELDTGITAPSQTHKIFHGWILAPFVAEKFFKGIFKDPSPELLTAIYFGEKQDPESLAYNSPGFAANRHTPFATVQIANQQIIFAFARSPYFNSNHDNSGAWILVCGAFIGILAAGLMASLQSTNRQAESIAALKTAELATSELRYRTLSQELERRIADRTRELEDANHKLRSKEARFRQLADSMPQIVWTVNEKGELNYLNQQWWKYIGESSEDYDLEKAHSCVHPDDQQMLAHEWTEALKKDDLFEIEYRLRRSDGVYRWHLGRVVTIFDSQGKLITGYGTATDIDDQKRMLDQLARSEQHFRELADSLPQIVWTARPDGTIDYFNERWYEFSGFARGVIGDHAWLTIMSQEDGQTALREWYHSVKTGAAYDVEHRFWDRKTHTYVWYWERALPIKNEQGEVVRWIGTCTNIDDKKKSEEALLHLAAIIESSEDAIIGEDLHGNITDWNKSAERIYQQRAVDTIGKSSLALFPPERVYEQMMILEYVKEGKIIRHFETEQLRQDGSRFPISISVSPIRNVSGEIHGISKIVRDITDEKRISSALKASEKQLSIVNNIIPGMIFYIDRHQKFLYNNKVTESLLEVQADHFVGKTMSEIMGPAHYLLAKPHIDAVLQGKISSFEDQIPGKGGKQLYISVKYVPDINDKGEVQGFVALVLDISDQKRAEEARYASSVRERAALEASELKSQFLANMSHEVRTPISGVIGMAGLLVNTKLDDNQREYVEAIAQSGDLLLNVVNDILDFSRVEAGKLKLETIEFDLKSTMNHLHKSFAPLATKKGIEFHIMGLERFEDLHLLGDPSRFSQVLGNLIANAIKFTQDGSVLVKVIGELNQVTDPNSMDLIIEISDTGIGISQDQISRLFSPFTQADESTSRKYGGSGLGLSISKRLVELMGGDIEVESRVNAGSTFRVNLNFELLNASPQLGDPNQEPEMDRLQNLRVLVAEDNQINQMIIEKILSDLQAKSTIVKNGLEVIKSLETENYDIILMDCQMPELDGFQTTEHIRKLSSSLVANIPIIAITANAMSDDRQRCLDVGMNDYLPKPIRFADLCHMLQKWARHPQKSPPPSGLRFSLSPESNKTDRQLSFNPDVLRELFDYESNPENIRIVATLMRSFAASIDRDLLSLDAAIRARDFGLVNLQAHTLKSTSAAMGAQKLSHLFADLENCARETQDPTQARVFMERLQLEKVEAIAKLTNFLQTSIDPKLGKPS